jgi:hypothetical protein
VDASGQVAIDVGVRDCAVAFGAGCGIGNRLSAWGTDRESTDPPRIDQHIEAVRFGKPFDLFVAITSEPDGEFVKAVLGEVVWDEQAAAGS